MNNQLIVIENRQLNRYVLDDKLEWQIGRVSKGCNPDIQLYSATVSRKQGNFINECGVWYYVDCFGKNGTMYNEKPIQKRRNNRIIPLELEEGDTFIFGGGTTPSLNSKTVWALYTTKSYGERWDAVDTQGMNQLTFTAGERETTLEHPQKGSVIDHGNGMGIYMGDITYVTDLMNVTGVSI
ncbi:MAG: FHA domain-containing protein [Eubacteriales bacterium]